MTVRDLLTASMMAHNAAKPKGRMARPAGWRELISEASRLRGEALEADPDRRDIAWSDFGDHDRIMAFYRDCLHVSVPDVAPVPVVEPEPAKPEPIPEPVEVIPPPEPVIEPVAVIVSPKPKAKPAKRAPIKAKSVKGRKR